MEHGGAASILGRQARGGDQEPGRRSHGAARRRARGTKEAHVVTRRVLRNLQNASEARGSLPASAVAGKKRLHGRSRSQAARGPACSPWPGTAGQSAGRRGGRGPGRARAPHGHAEVGRGHELASCGSGTRVWPGCPRLRLRVPAVTGRTRSLTAAGHRCRWLPASRASRTGKAVVVRALCPVLRVTPSPCHVLTRGGVTAA